MSENINENNKSEDVLLKLKTEYYYGDLFKQVSVPIVICDTANRVVEINGAFEDLFGYSRTEAVDKYCYDLIAPPAKKMNFMDDCNEIHKKGIQHKKMKLVDKRGKLIDVDFTGHPILENGKVVGTYRIYENLKKENDIKNELALQKAYFEGFFNTSIEALVLLDKNDRVVYFNEEFHKLFGYTLKYAKGKLINDIVAKGERKDEAESISLKALKSERITINTVRYHKDGRPINIRLVVNPVTKNNKLLGIYAIYKDLTAESRMEKELEIQTQYFKQLFERSLDAMVLLDPSQKVMDANKAFVELFGYKLEECKNKDIDALIVSKEYLNESSKLMKDTMEGIAVNKETKRANKSGELINVEASGSAVVVGGEAIGTVVNYRDISERKKNIIALEEQRAYFKQLFDNSPQGIVIIDIDGNVVDANKGFCKMFEYEKSEIRGKYINDFIAPQGLFDEAELLSSKLIDGGVVKFITKRRSKTNKLIDVDILAYPIWLNNKQIGGYAIYSDITEQKLAEKEIEKQTQYYKHLFENSIDAMVLVDDKEKIMDINKTFETLFGYEKKESYGRNIDDLIVSKEYRGEADVFEHDVHNGQIVKKETKRMAKDKTLIDVETFGTPVIIENKFVGTLANYRDIRERKGMVEALDKQRAYFKQLFDNSPQGIVMIDTQERVVDVNRGFCKMFEYEKAETIGELINDLIAPESLLDEAEGLSAKVIGGGVVKYETKRRSKTYKLIDVDILAYPVKLNKEHVGGYAIYSDITEKKRAEKEIETLAYRDSLTGLFNRRVLYDKLNAKIKNIEKGKKFAVCYIDLDGFKRINDSMGHNVGDELLRYVAKNIQDSMEKEDVVARMGGDEFVIFTDCVDYEKIGAKMESIIERLQSGLKIFNYNIKISLSIGVSIYPDHGNNVEEIIKKADTAMYMAKRNALRGYLIFTAEMDKNTNDRFELENRLKMALANGEIEMHYQPILSMDGAVKGCEALMRWENPVIGKVPPNVFIPIAEDGGEIHQLGAFALNQSLIVLKKWKKRFGDDFFMSINISVKQMERENIVDTITEIMKKNGIEGKNVHLEITESCSTENVIGLKKKLSSLSEMGFAISIDDFGTGYSSFMQLRDSYADFLKMDRSFVDGIEKRDDNRAIVKAIVAMGKSLGVGIIAEGVETDEEFEIIKSLDCEMYQGYLTQRPDNEKNIEAFIKKNMEK